MSETQSSTGEKPRFSASKGSKEFPLSFDWAKVDAIEVSLQVQDKETKAEIIEKKTLAEWFNLFYRNREKLASDGYRVAVIDGKTYTEKELTIGAAILKMFVEVLSKGGSQHNAWFLVDNQDGDANPDHPSLNQVTTFFLASGTKITVDQARIVWEEKDGQPSLWDLIENPVHKWDTAPYLDKRAYARLMYEKFYSETDAGKIEAIKAKISREDSEDKPATIEAEVKMADLRRILLEVLKVVRSFKLWALIGIGLLILLHWAK